MTARPTDERLVTDRSLPSAKAYGTGRHLAARQFLCRWQSPRHDLPGIVVDELAGVCCAVADVGCGNGKFVARVREDRTDRSVAVLGTVFDEIRAIPLPGVIEVTDAGPVVAHLASYEAWADRMGVPFRETIERAAAGRGAHPGRGCFPYHLPGRHPRLPETGATGPASGLGRPSGTVTGGRGPRTGAVPVIRPRAGLGRRWPSGARSLRRCPSRRRPR